VTDTITPEPRKPRRTDGVIGLLLALLGTVLMAFSFVNGISAALDGSSEGAGGYVALFLLGMVLVLVTLVLAIFRLIRGSARVLSLLTVIVAAVPIITILYLRFSA